MYGNKKIWNVAYPIIFSILSENIISITDTAFLGRVGEVELGGAALGGLLYLIFFMLGFGFSTGSQILMARRNGEGEFNKIAPIFMQGSGFLLILAFLGVAVVYFTVPMFIHSIVDSERVAASTLAFLKWRVWGLFFGYLAGMYRAFFVGITKTKVLTMAAVFMAVINIFLDYGLVFGKFGLPQMGIEGAALASVISEFFFFLFFVVFSVTKLDLKKYGFSEKISYNHKQLAHVLNISFWIMFQYFLAMSTWFIFFIATEHLGERSLAVSNIVRSVSSMLFMCISAYGTTTNTLVSNLMGEGKTEDVPGQIFKILKQCAVLITPVIVALWLFPEQVLMIYTDNPELIQATIPSIRVLVSAYVIAAPAMLYFQFVSGTGNTRSAFGMEVATLIFYMLFIWIVAFKKQLPVDICWYSEHIYWGGLLIFSYIYLKKADWQSKKI